MLDGKWSASSIACIRYRRGFQGKVKSVFLVSSQLSVLHPE